MTTARFAAAPRSTAYLAFRSGGLSSFVVTGSSRSFSGWVLRASFASPAGAGRFAAAAARRAGVSVAVRSFGPGCFVVSVPVAVPSRAPYVGRSVVWSGGVRGFAAALPRVGLVRPLGGRRA